MNKKNRYHNLASSSYKRPGVTTNRHIVSHGETAKQVHELVKEVNAGVTTKQGGGSRKQSNVVRLSQLKRE